MKIQLLISKTSWARNYLDTIKKDLSKYCGKIHIIHNEKNLKKNYEVNIIFSYFKKISVNYLKRSKYNLIPHESKLPYGRGMSPLTWQLIKGKSKIYFSLIEASEKIDDGNIYFQKKIFFKKDYLFKEIKEIQLKESLGLIIKFLMHLKKFKKPPISRKQVGKISKFRLRKPADSKLNINKSIKKQFNILRICDPQNYPAFFYFQKKKYYLFIKKK